LAQPAPAPAPPAAPDGAALTVFLMTMGPGELSWERFGHNAVWIVDRARGTSRAYNWGVFDFQQENFYLNFARGRMRYYMAGYDGRRTVDFYARANRSVWVQELRLAPAQRAELAAALARNERPEEREYRYDYYQDNCSTRARDALDRVLGGRLRAALDTIPTTASWRFHTRRLTQPDPLLYTGLQLLLGRRTDRPLSVWEAAFLPMELKQAMWRVQVPGPDGRLEPLVIGEKTLFQSTRAAEPLVPPAWWPRYLVLGLALGLLGVGGGWLARRRGRPAPVDVAVPVLWSGVTGAAGLLLAWLWLGTDHAVAAANENVLLLPVTGLATAWALWRAARRDDASAARVALACALLGVVLAGAALLAKAAPGGGQDNGEVLALCLPAQAGVLAAAAGVRRVAGVSPATPGARRS
ncbi:MAG: DUF4105 domain-containing protein, partial [Gemmatimonadales bacterium]|nr:DUF4105 domain-containing protein [Gemmatimonadales bacterium]